MCQLFAYLFVVFALRTTLAQVSGDFWWLHKETENINGKKISAPKFENLTSLENDEYDKITFKKHTKYLDPSADKKNKTLNKKSNDEKNKSWIVRFPDWNDMVSASLHEDNKNQLNINVTVQNNVTEEVDRDLFTFNFSDEDIERKMWSINASTTSNNHPSLDTTTTEPSHSWINNISEIKQHKDNKNVTDKHKLIFRVDVKYNPKSESICTFIGKEECLYKNGHVYKQLKRFNPKDKVLVCCILPLKQSQKEGKESQNERIVFPDYSEQLLDKKRTTRDLEKKSSIVTLGDDDYEDPYANIRNHRVSTQKIITRNRYSPTGYKPIDYIDEVPTPGMLGHYNADDGDDGYDYYNGNDYDSVVSEEDESLEQGYGAPTTNPRVDYRPGAITKRPKVKSNRFTTTSTDDLTVQVAAHVVNYHANPDFLVLKGYKLLNLVKNQTRLPSQPSKSTTEIMPESNEYSDEIYDSSGPQYHYSCDYEDNSEDNNGYSRQNSGGRNRPPWLGIVFRNRQTGKTSCYATLIHRKAAITVASCVHGSKPGEISFYIGSKRNIQRRIASVKSSGSSLQNIAILYWSQPLKLNVDVKPACLDNPTVGETCLFQAWTLRDRGPQSEARTIRAVFLKTKECTGGVSKAFCAFLKGDGLVPHLGGALVCVKQGRQAAAVGVMAQRSSLSLTNLPPSQIAVLPIRQWTLNQLRTLGLI